VEAGSESWTFSTLQLLLNVQEGSGDERSAATTRQRVNRLAPRVTPRLWARMQLEESFGVGDGASNGDGATSVLARLILEASKAPRVASRVARLEALRKKALAERSLLETLITDLFLFGDFARKRDRPRMKRIIREISELEQDPSVQERLDDPITPRLQRLMDSGVVRSPRKRKRRKLTKRKSRRS
jgi:hypothetical protein